MCYNLGFLATFAVMKKDTRITIETDKEHKDALKSILREYDTSLTDWITSKVEEAIPFYEAYSNSNLFPELQNDLLKTEVLIDKLKSIDWSFTDFNTQYFSHNLHPYPAKFIPQIPYHLIRILSKPGEKVFDPFGGSGTTALEAILAKRQAISSDINPVSQIVGKAKTLTLSREEEDALTSFCEDLFLFNIHPNEIIDLYNKHHDAIIGYIPQIPNLEKWFHPNVIRELAILKWKISNLSSENCKTLSLAVFSKIIVKASFQDSETRYVSKFREIECGYTLKLFSSELISVVKKLKSAGPIKNFADAEFYVSDIRFEKPVQDNSIDLIVTSPPYPNATDYHLYHRFRIFWLGEDPVDLGKKEIGSHLRHQKESTGIDNYIEEMKLSLINMYSVLRPGRFAVLVVGDGKFKNKIYETSELLSEVGKDVGFEVVQVINRNVHTSKRSFASPARRLSDEKILILKKPSTPNSTFVLEKPLYKLWGFEEKLCKIEVARLFKKEEILQNNGQIEISGNDVIIDKLKRLTFVKSYYSENFNRELTWQGILEDIQQNGNGKRKNSKYVTHGIHDYKGKFYPHIAKSLFNIAELEYGQTVLDPFSGSGTVLLEAFLNGFKGLGMDMNPLAVQIARVKTSILQVNPNHFEQIISKFISNIDKTVASKNNESYFPDAVLSELHSWFPESVVWKLGSIFNLIEEIPITEIKSFIEVLISSIIRQISHQDPNDLRIRRRKELLNDAPVFELLKDKLLHQKDEILNYAKIRNKSVFRNLKNEIWLADNRLEKSYFDNNIKSNSVDVIVTSPPYATALPYIDTDRLSILLLFQMLNASRTELERNITGSREIKVQDRKEIEHIIERGEFDEIYSDSAVKLISSIYDSNKTADVGFRKKNNAAVLYRYFRDMTLTMTQLNKVLKPNKSAFFVIGNNKTTIGEKTIDINTARVLIEIAAKLGWYLERTIPISVTKENYKHNKNSITQNDILWFTKGS